MEKEGRKWSKLSIISFVLVIVTMILEFLLLNIITLFLSLALLVTVFILSIISLFKIKKHNLKGMIFSIISLVVSSGAIIITGVYILIVLLFLFGDVNL